jgi:hypothetical protein
VGWLLTFCIGYVTLATDREANYIVPCPPIPVFLAVSAICGLYRGYFHLVALEDIGNMTHGSRSLVRVVLLFVRLPNFASLLLSSFPFTSYISAVGRVNVRPRVICTL